MARTVIAAVLKALGHDAVVHSRNVVHRHAQPVVVQITAHIACVPVGEALDLPLLPVLSAIASAPLLQLHADPRRTP
jgi:hypothetical protein